MLSQSIHSNFIRSFVNIHFIGHNVDKIVKGSKGENLLQIAEKNQIHIPNACEGMGACGTCQVYIEKGMNLLSEITDRENDSLDFAVDVQDNSRLACRATLLSDEGDISVTIPKQSRNII